MDKCDVIKMKKKSKRWGIPAAIIALVLLVVGTTCVMWQMENQRRQKEKVLLIAFDDYNEQSWRETFDLFDRYDAQVTFFVSIAEPTDFCKEAVDRGHEIGFHTESHANLTELSEEEIYNVAIAPIELFREQGIHLTSFAYPYGAYEDWMNGELLKYYKIVRGAFSFQVKFKSDVNGGFIESASLDNVHFETDEAFRARVEEYLDVFAQCDEGTTASVYSHAIGDGDWCITAERLEILLQEAAERDIKCRTFKYLQ